MIAMWRSLAMTRFPVLERGEYIRLYARSSPVRQIALLLALPWLVAEAAAPEPHLRPRFEPTSPEIVRAMLEMARVWKNDVVVDLGCGDGRIVIEAVKRFRAARAVCVDIDPRRIEEARRHALDEGVLDRIEFRTEDALKTSLEKATVVTLFLSHDLNQALKPRLQAELPPGARVVSHWHGMEGWTPERTVHIRQYYRTHPIYLWTIK